jgi:hypothetical protein
MALPKGDWTILADGVQGTLTIRGVDGEGNLDAQLLLAGRPTEEPLIGFWDDVSKKITFLRVYAPNAPSDSQVYTGFYFNVSGTDVTHTLTGFLEAFAGTGGVAQRVLYGWYATMTIIG